MMNAKDNQLVTEVGPGTGCGNVLRQYWQPAALTEELVEDRPLKSITLLGEELIIYKTEKGEYGLIGRFCPHRGADLRFGRLENGGIRCPFHGWLFNEKGSCLEQPAEPSKSKFHLKIRHVSYPCRERNGVIFAYLGEGAPPPFPSFDCFSAPEDYAFAFKGFVDCNWLQFNEVGIDPAHASFLHRFFDDGTDDESYGQQFRFSTEENAMAITQVLRDYDCPELSHERTTTGLRIFALRHLNEKETHVRVTNLIFPNAIVLPLSNDIALTQWHVPIDDTRSWWYGIFTNLYNPVDKKRMRDDRLTLYTLPDYLPRMNKTNDYGYNPEEQKTKTYTGMGQDINVHDQWAVESLGSIQDRTREHLGASDKIIIESRKLLLKAIKDNMNGKKPAISAWPINSLHQSGPVTIDTVVPSKTWNISWKKTAEARRKKSCWAQDISVEHMTELAEN